jgi:hypothetical protein
MLGSVLLQLALWLSALLSRAVLHTVLLQMAVLRSLVFWSVVLRTALLWTAVCIAFGVVEVGGVAVGEVTNMGCVTVGGLAFGEAAVGGVSGWCFCSITRVSLLIAYSVTS